MPQDLTVVPAPFDVPTTVARLRTALDERGIEVFAVVDHAAGARAAGLALADEVMILFGNPAVGTALMHADPRAGLDLPLRMLVWSADGATSVGFRNPRWLAEYYDVASAGDVLDRLNGLLATLAAEAAG